MPEKKYLPGVASSVYEILSRDSSSVKNPKFHVRCNVCGKEKTITRNTLTKYMQSNECMCKGRTLDANVGDVFGIYTIIETEYRNGHTFVSFRCNVCGHVRTRQRFVFIRDFSHETVCRCKKNVWKDTILHASSSEMKEKSERKYKSFVGEKIGVWHILDMYSERQDKRIIRYYWCKCSVCGTFKRIRTDFVVNSSGNPILCKHRFKDYSTNSRRRILPQTNEFILDKFGNESALLGEYSRLFGTPLFMESIAQASIDGTLCELGNYFCLDGISTKQNMIPSNKAKQLAFRREHPNWESVWYNKSGTKRIRHFKTWKHGRRARKRFTQTVICDT